MERCPRIPGLTPGAMGMSALRAWGMGYTAEFPGLTPGATGLSALWAWEPGLSATMPRSDALGYGNVGPSGPAERDTRPEFPGLTRWAMGMSALRALRIEEENTAP